MSMSIRTNFLFVMLAALAANAFASSDGCSTEDTNMLLQAQKIMRTPKDEHRSLGEWKRYRRRHGWRRQHPHGYYVPETSTTVAATTSTAAPTSAPTAAPTTTPTTAPTTTPTTTPTISCSGQTFSILDTAVTLPDASNTTFSSSETPGQQDGCCLRTDIFLSLTFFPPASTPSLLDFQVSIKSPVSIDIPSARSFFPGPGSAVTMVFRAISAGNPAPDGPWELVFFYPSEWKGKDVRTVTVDYLLERCNDEDR